MPRAPSARWRKTILSVETPRRRLQPWQALLAAVLGMFLAAIGSLIAQLIGTIVVVVATGQDFIAASTSWQAVTIAVVGTGLVLVALSVLPPLLARARLRDALGLNGAHWLAFPMAAIGVLALSPLADAMMQLAKQVAPWATFGTLEALHETFEHAPLWVVLPIVSIFPGVSEELFFRGMVQRGLDDGTRPMRLLAVFVSGGAFAAFHLDPHHVIGVLPLGFYMAWVAARAQSTWVTIFAHAVNNAMAVAASRIPDVPDADEPLPAWAIAVGLAVWALTVLVIWAVTRKPKPIGGATVYDPVGP